MILSDHDIRRYLAEGKIVIEPLDDPEAQIQPASVDLRLGPEFMRFKPLDHGVVDFGKKINSSDYTEPVKYKSGVFLHPDEFILARTLETVTVPKELAACIDGKSSLGRLGVEVHISSGWIDPGFSGVIVLEIKNAGKLPVKLHPGMKIIKIIFMELTSPSDRPYGSRNDSKYQGQRSIVPSRIEKEFEQLDSF